MRRRAGIVCVLALVACTHVAHGRGAMPAIDWARVRNPILGYRDRATKDPALVWASGRWHALFSSVGSSGAWRVGIVSSADLRHWSRLAFLPHDPDVEGEASPDVVRAPDGRFVVTYQSFVHDTAGAQAKLWYRTTSDFRTFSAPHRLGIELHPAAGERVIDPALAWTPAGLLLGYKVGGTDTGQAFEIARSSSGTLEGPWVLVGRPDIRVLGDTIENYQFLHLDGRWMLLATSNNLDRPYVFDVAGDVRDPRGWLHWSPGRELAVPQEAWNPGRGVTGATYEHANCAFVVDGRRVGGAVYLVYADSPEMSSFGGEGHAQLGLARSTDLVHWSVPPT